MLKNFKKKPLKIKIAIIALIVVLLALVGYVLYEQFKPTPPVAYEIATVSKGAITDSLDISGTVQSGYSHNYVAIEGVRAQEVKVSVGDEIKKGDLLATFDVSGASKYLASAKKEYDKALKDYNEATQGKANNDTAIKNKNAEIAKKRSEIAELEKKLTEQGQTVTNQPLSQDQINAMVAQMQASGATQEQIDAFIANAGSMTIPTATGNSALQQELTKKTAELARLNSDLIALQAQGMKNLGSDNDTYMSFLKNNLDTKKQAYDSIKSVYDELKNGWYADKDGIITKVNITAGEAFVPVKESTDSLNLGAFFGSSQYSNILSGLMGSEDNSSIGTGLILDSYEDMIVTVSVGKSDLLKIKTGMKATVTSLSKEYEAEIIYVSATASESSGGFDIGTITNSLMGGNGSSGALVQVKIKNPDKNLVIGFDADVRIALVTLEDVLKIPVEAVVYDNGSYYVYIYNKDKKTVSKQTIAHGILDDTSYQITDGLKEGDLVIKSPAPNLEDGTKIAEKQVKS